MNPFSIGPRGGIFMGKALIRHMKNTGPIGFYPQINSKVQYPIRPELRFFEFLILEFVCYLSFVIWDFLRTEFNSLTYYQARPRFPRNCPQAAEMSLPLLFRIMVV